MTSAAERALMPLTDEERALIRLRMAQEALTEDQAAAKMGVSRPTLRRLLDPAERVRPWVTVRARGWLDGADRAIPGD